MENGKWKMEKPEGKRENGSEALAETEKSQTQAMSELHRGFNSICFGLSPVKVARDSGDITHSLKQASIHTSHVHASTSCAKYEYSLHLVQSTSTH